MAIATDLNEYLRVVEKAVGLGELMRKTGPQARPDRFVSGAVSGFSGHVSPDGQDAHLRTDHFRALL